MLFSSVDVEGVKVAVGGIVEERKLPAWHSERNMRRTGSKFAYRWESWTRIEDVQRRSIQALPPPGPLVVQTTLRDCPGLGYTCTDLFPYSFTPFDGPMLYRKETSSTLHHISQFSA